MRASPFRLGWGSFHHVDGKPKVQTDLLMHDMQETLPRALKYGARSPYHRQYIMRTMLTELIRRDFLIIAGKKAHALAIYANNAVTLTKRGDTTSRQQLAYFLLDNYMVDKAFDEFPGRFRRMTRNYVAVSWLREIRRKDHKNLFFVEFRNRAGSPTHMGDDTERSPERFFLPQPQLEGYKDREIPKHWQMIFDRWASKYKTPQFFTWWKIRHATLRFWGYRNVPHPADVAPLWSEKEEEEFQRDMNVVPEEESPFDLDDEKVNLGEEKVVSSGLEPLPQLS